MVELIKQKGKIMRDLENHEKISELINELL